MRHSNRQKLVTGILALLVLSGCGGMLGGGGGSSRDYVVTTNRETFSRGNTGEATIRNASDETLQYNLCQRRLERQVNRSWVTAFEWPTAGGSCTSESRSLLRRTSVNTFFDIPTGVPAGTYRMVFTGLLGKDGRTVSPDDASTPRFEVR